jgi:hypothetical protein
MDMGDKSSKMVINTSATTSTVAQMVRVNTNGIRLNALSMGISKLVRGMVRGLGRTHKGRNMLEIIRMM